MQSVFEKYNGENPESTVVDYLQEQVRKHLNFPENYFKKEQLSRKEGVWAGKRGEEGQYGCILELSSAAVFSI